jgi:hypothetical protein
MSIAIAQFQQPLMSRPLLPTLLVSQSTNPKLALNEWSNGDSNRPGSATTVDGHLSADESRALYDNLKRRSPELNNHFTDQKRPLAGAALLRFVSGAGGLVRLPDNFVESKTYYQDPAATNTEALVDRFLSGKSATPGSKVALAKMKALKVGESFTFTDYNNHLIDMRKLTDPQETKKRPPEVELDRMMTLGNATFNTNAKVTITNLGERGYRIDVQSTHVVLDRYDWNATVRDTEAAAARTTLFKDRNGGLIAVNHADWHAMKEYGAKDYSVGLAATETRTYLIPRSTIKKEGMDRSPFKGWRSGGLNKHLQIVTKPGLVKNPLIFKEYLSRASKQNNSLVPIPDVPVSPLNELKYMPGAGSYRLPTNPTRGPIQRQQ